MRDRPLSQLVSAAEGLYAYGTSNRSKLMEIQIVSYSLLSKLVYFERLWLLRFTGQVLFSCISRMTRCQEPRPYPNTQALSNVILYDRIDKGFHALTMINSDSNRW